MKRGVGGWRGLEGDDDEVLLNVLRCQLTHKEQVVTNAEARFNKSLRPRKPEGSLGRTSQDVHLNSHTAPNYEIGGGGGGERRRLYT